MPVSSTNRRHVLRFPERRASHLDAYCRGLPSEGTRRVYRRIAIAFERWASVPVDQVTRRTIESYREHLEVLGRAPTTIAQHLAAICGYFQFLEDEGVIDSNPAARVRRPKIAEPPPKQGITPAEVRRLLEVCDPATMIGLRDRALVLTLSVQAFRISEALGITVETLGEEAGHHVAQIIGKGNKPARVPLAPIVHEAMQQWLDAADIHEGPIFVPVSKGGVVKLGRAISSQSGWKRIKHLGQQAGIERALHPHLARHGAATAALAAGVALHRVQDHLRHADPRTTRRYDSQRRSLSNPCGPVVADLIKRAD
ncbi:MAG: tyrosine-type recombinase/integrase [Nannocystaceae bacterium]